MQRPNFKDFWIGLTDAVKEGDFLWRSNDKPLSPDLKKHWREGEPSNYGGTEHCGHFWTSGLNDAKCSREYYFVCQKREIQGKESR